MKNYIETDDPTKNVFISLLKVYLRPNNGEKLMLEPAIRLLSRHGSYVSASDVSLLFFYLFIVIFKFCDYKCLLFHIGFEYAPSHNKSIGIVSICRKIYQGEQ